MTERTAPIFLTIRVDAATKRALEALAERAGLSLAAFIRKLTVAEVARGARPTSREASDRHSRPDALR